MPKYWVGNGGNWGDTNHWSNSSGGAGGAGVPQGWDDVIFDQNSFTIDDQHVVIPAEGATCEDLDMTAVNRHFILESSNGWYIWRSARFSPHLEKWGSGGVLFSSDVSEEQIIDLSTVVFGGAIKFTNGGVFKVVSDIKTTGDIDFRECVLTFEGSLIEAPHIWSDITTQVRDLNFGTGILRGDIHFEGGANLIIHDSDYTIETNYWFATFNCNINHLKVKDDKVAIISGSNTFKKLTVEPGGYLAVTVDTTQTVTEQLSCVGLVDDYSEFIDRDNAGTFNLNIAGATVLFDYATLRGINIVGGPITAYRSSNLNRNSGITFNPGPPPSPSQRKFRKNKSIRFSRRWR